MVGGPMEPAKQKRVLGVVFATVFLDLIGFGIIIPVQPFFAEEMGASPTLVTLLGGSFSLMQFLFAPFWGRLSDRLGRRPVMLVSISVALVGYVAFGLAQSLEMLFLARMLSGFGSANIGTAQAVVADVTPGDGRAKGMGLIGAAFGLGFTLGPAIGGFFVQFGLPAPAFAAAVLAGLNLGFAYFWLPETYRPEVSAEVPRKHGLRWGAIKHAARHTNVWQLFLLYLGYAVAFSLMEQVMGLFIERTWVGPGSAKEAARLTAYVLIVIGITSIVIQGGLIGRLAKRFGEVSLLRTGIFLVALSFAAIPMVGWWGPYSWLLWVSLLMAMGTSITAPSISSLLSRSVDADEQGGVMGLGQSMSALGRVVGPVLAGPLFEVSHGLPFWVGSGLALGCVALAFTVRLSRGAST